MKKLMLSISIAALTLHSQAMHLFFRPVTLGTPPTTNYVVQTVVTNGQTFAQTNEVITPAIAPQWGMNPTMTTVLDTGKTVSGFLPPPYDVVVSGGLAAIGTLLGFVLKKKNGQLSTTQTILQSVITGVEAVGDATTKLSIQSHANAAGVQGALEPIVQSVTANSPGAIIAPAK